MANAGDRGLIVVCGNPMRGDDGVAWRVGEALETGQARARFELLQVQQPMPEHAEALSKASWAIFLDCSALHAPGEVCTHLLKPAIEKPRIFTHHLDPESLLALTLDLYGRIPSPAYAVNIGGQSFAFGYKLSAPVEAAIPLALEAVDRIVRGLDGYAANGAGFTGYGRDTGPPNSPATVPPGPQGRYNKRVGIPRGGTQP